LLERIRRRDGDQRSVEGRQSVSIHVRASVRRTRS
jgi:hypothetical protein